MDGREREEVDDYHCESPWLTMLTAHARIDLHIREIHFTFHRHDFSSIERHSMSEISRVLVVHSDLHQSS